MARHRFRGVHLLGLLMGLQVLVTILLVQQPRPRPSRCPLEAFSPPYMIPADLEGPSVTRCIIKYHAKLSPQHLVTSATLGPFLVQYEIVHRYHMPLQYDNFCFAHASCVDEPVCLKEYRHGELDFAFSTFFYEPGRYLGWRWNEETKEGLILVYDKPAIGFRPRPPASADATHGSVLWLVVWLGLSILLVGATLLVRTAGWKTIAAAALVLLVEVVLLWNALPAKRRGLRPEEEVVRSVPEPPCAPYPGTDVY